MGRGMLLILVLFASIGIGACTSPGIRREESLRRAEEAAGRGDLDRAAEILRAAQGFDPRDQQIVARLAQVYEEDREYWQALRLVDGFPEEVQEPHWLNLRARLLLRCGRIREGVRLSTSLAQKGKAEEETFQAFSDIVVQHRLGPEPMDDLPVSWIRGLGERLANAGGAGAALSWLERLSPTTDLEEDGLVQRLVDLALESDDRSLVQRVDNLVSNADSPLGLLIHRHALVLAGKKTEVARLDARFLASFPDDPRGGEILESEGRRHLARGAFEQALSHADRALALDGSRVEALILRGLALEWSGKIEEGRAALRTALALEPDNRVAREALRSTRSPETLIMRFESPEP